MPMSLNAVSPFARPFDATMQQQFAELQKKLPQMWSTAARANLSYADQLGENSKVIIPSMTLDADFSSSTIRAFEERMLFLLLLLRQVNLSMIYVTSMPISERVIDYYLSLIPGIVPSNARSRLKLISVEDASSRPLTTKLLERPWLVERIRSQIPDMNTAHMLVYMTTDLERELALKLGIPMYAADPQYYAFGLKSGCRRLFAQEGIKHPLGVESLHTLDEVVEAIAGMRKTRPDMTCTVLKLNDASSGFGNAFIDISGLPAPGDPTEAEQILERINSKRLEDSSNNYELYQSMLKQFGGIVEEYIDGLEYSSPSGQCRITPLGEVELISSHDQLMGGPTGGIYVGALFPANPEYSQQVMEATERIGKRLASEGVIGRFSADYVMVKTEADGWVLYAIEINLRKGATTAPYLILQYLTDGHYDVEDGVFRTSQGNPKYYVASDQVMNEAYRILTVEHLFELVSRNNLHYDHTSQTGVVMHMVSGVGETGLVGITAIHDAPEQAQALYQQFTNAMDEMAANLSQSVVQVAG